MSTARNNVKHHFPQPLSILSTWVSRSLWILLKNTHEHFNTLSSSETLCPDSIISCCTSTILILVFITHRFVLHKLITDGMKTLFQYSKRKTSRLTLTLHHVNTRFIHFSRGTQTSDWMYEYWRNRFNCCIT